MTETDTTLPRVTKKHRRWLIAACFFTVALIGLSVCLVSTVQRRYADRIVLSPTQAPVSDIAIVLGASVNKDGTPSDALRDRLQTGVDLWKQHKVSRILITGDDGSYHVDEIDTMRAFLLANNIPADRILEDGHGYRTYESCKRAAQIFHVTKATVVTQRFHMSRALYLCNRLGVDATGVTSDLQPYRSIRYFWVRDLAASLEAWVDVNVLPPRSPVSFTETDGTAAAQHIIRTPPPVARLPEAEPEYEAIQIASGTQEMLVAEPVEATATVPTAPPPANVQQTQFVLLAFDGSYSIPMWINTRAFAQQMKLAGKPVSFTYFVSGVYLLTDAASKTYEAPHERAGMSAIGFGGAKKDVADRIEQINLALQEGHEIGSHANGHYSGAAWTADDWRKELSRFATIVANVNVIDGLQDQPPIRNTIALPLSGIIGFRAPQLGADAALFPVLKELGYRYDASKGAKDGLWPGKMPEGIWEFALPRIAYAATSSTILSMDYNFFFKQTGAKNTLTKGTPEWDQTYQETLTSFTNAFDAHYAETRAPLQIGNHFSTWNDGVYWEAMKAFAERVCGLPDVRCVTMSTLANELDRKK